MTATIPPCGSEPSQGPTGHPDGPGTIFPAPQSPLGPPPAFAPYEAESFEVGNGDIVSHDEHLNTDGEALYRFLLTQANQRPPSYRIRCKGSHVETRYHNRHDHHSNARSSSHSTETEHVVDFDFSIDVTPPFPSSSNTSLSPEHPLDSKAPAHNQADLLPVHWSVADDEPAYRGKMVREVESTSFATAGFSQPDDNIHLSRRKASQRQCKDYDRWVEQRISKGLPPWVSGINSWNITNPTERDVLKSSKSLREWADEYCASGKLLKEFVYTKVLYGWDISQLETAIQDIIAMAPYHGNIEVSFQPLNSRVYIRPSNKLSRALSNGWLKFLSIVLLLFPFIWLFKRFHSKGGGKWQVCGGAYALKKWVPLNDQHLNSQSNGGNELPAYEDIAGPSMSTPTSSLPTPSPSTLTTTSSRVLQTPQGPRKLIGQREGEWFRLWEPIIIRAVLLRHQATSPLTLHNELCGRPGGPGSALEGYHEVDASTAQPEFNRRSGGIFLP